MENGAIPKWLSISASALIGLVAGIGWKLIENGNQIAINTDRIVGIEKRLDLQRSIYDGRIDAIGSKIDQEIEHNREELERRVDKPGK